MGMAHRGRLNVLANVVGNLYERIFASFEGSVHPGFQPTRATLSITGEQRENEYLKMAAK